jgi:hypothetical protein
MTAITKIVFLHEGHFSRTYYEMFGIKILEDNGFKVEVWNFMPFLKNVDFQEATPPDPIAWDGYHVFQTKKEANKAISSVMPTSLVICGLHYSFETYTFYRALTKRKIIFCSNLAMALPTGTISSIRSVSNILQKIKFKRLMNRAFQMIPFEMTGVKPVDIVFAMGDKFFRHGYPMNEKSEILDVHFYDYDKFLMENEKPSHVDPKVGVFLDECLAFHPDNIDMAVPAVKVEEYYPLLCTFFDYLEQTRGVRIIVAAHPRSKYDEMPDLFGGRAVIRGKTVELVKKAGFVILHQSMSLNYAVLFEKPMIFITTDKVEEYLIEDPSPEWLATFFGKKLHNLNDTIEIDFTKELTVDRKAYRAYRNAYIKKDGSPELPFWQIVANRIKEFGQAA